MIHTMRGLLDSPGPLGLRQGFTELSKIKCIDRMSSTGFYYPTLRLFVPYFLMFSPTPWTFKDISRFLFLLEGHGSLLVLGSSEVIYSFLTWLCSAFGLLSGAVMAILSWAVL